MRDGIGALDQVRQHSLAGLALAEVHVTTGKRNADGLKVPLLCQMRQIDEAMKVQGADGFPDIEPTQLTPPPPQLSCQNILTKLQDCIGVMMLAKPDRQEEIEWVT